MQESINKKVHLVYVRFAFPLAGEPGPKRPLEIVERYRQVGHRITVITSGSNFMTGKVLSNKRLFVRTNEKGVEFIRVAAVPKYRSSMFRRLLNYAVFTLLAFLAGLKTLSKKEKNAVIFVDISPPFAVLGGYLLSMFKRNSRLVLEITDLPESVFKLGLFNRPFLCKITDKVFRHIYSKADHIVTLTAGAKRHIKDLGIDGKKISTVMNWANPDALQPVPFDEIERIRSRHGWDGKFVVLYAGGHGQAYDLMTLIHAAEKLRDRSDLKIVFMGEGERKKEYIEYCKKRGSSTQRME